MEFSRPLQIARKTALSGGYSGGLNNMAEIEGLDFGVDYGRSFQTPANR
jgi:hypothetical protein